MKRAPKYAIFGPDALPTTARTESAVPRGLRPAHAAPQAILCVCLEVVVHLGTRRFVADIVVRKIVNAVEVDIVVHKIVNAAVTVVVVERTYAVKTSAAMRKRWVVVEQVLVAKHHVSLSLTFFLV